MILQANDDTGALFTHDTMCGTKQLMRDAVQHWEAVHSVESWSAYTLLNLDWNALYYTVVAVNFVVGKFSWFLRMNKDCEN